jgi:hypothetical protein
VDRTQRSELMAKQVEKERGLVAAAIARLKQKEHEEKEPAETVGFANSA